MNVVVTGASSGIGEALALELAKRGHTVVLAARRLDKLQEVAKRCGPKALAVQCDVTDRAQVSRLFYKAIEHCDPLDAWVNNAGRGISKSLEHLTDDDIDAMVRDNLKSALYGMQAVLPYFRQRGEGVIANVSSMLARTPRAPFRSAYSAAKAAVNSLTETLRLELAQTHPRIRVLTVMPGVVSTDFGNNALGGGPDSRALPGAQDVHEVARVIADALPERAGDVYTRPGAEQQVAEYLRALAKS
jgi:NAD(P)-dependent dehydrogenase (short-subunit alcohol dehydrogenase family)